MGLVFELPFFGYVEVVVEDEDEEVDEMILKRDSIFITVSERSLQQLSQMKNKADRAICHMKLHKKQLRDFVKSKAWRVMGPPQR